MKFETKVSFEFVMSSIMAFLHQTLSMLITCKTMLRGNGIKRVKNVLKTHSLYTINLSARPQLILSFYKNENRIGNF